MTREIFQLQSEFEQNKFQKETGKIKRSNWLHIFLTDIQKQGQKL